MEFCTFSRAWGRVPVPGLQSPPHTLMGSWGVRKEYHVVNSAWAIKVGHKVYDRGY